MLRVLFAGTPDFAVPTLKALIEDPDIAIEYVLTQPDRPSGRGQKVSESAVKQSALAANLAVRQPMTLKDPNEIAWIQEQEFDAIVVVAYGQILNAAVLQSPRLGCLNVHASLLPKWRGAAPLQRAIEAGDTETGITIMLMDEGLDTGPMLNTASVPIDDQTTTAELHDQLATIGGPLLVHSLKRFDQGAIQPIQQPRNGVTYAHKITTDNACICWNRDHTQVMRQIHAFNSIPGAFTFAGSSRIKIYSVRQAGGSPRQAGILWKENDQILVSTHNRNLQILDCQLPGGKRMMLEQMLSHQSVPWIEPIQLLEQGA